MDRGGSNRQVGELKFPCRWAAKRLHFDHVIVAGRSSAIAVISGIDVSPSFNATVILNDC